MSTNLPNQNPLNYFGTRATRPPQQFFRTRAPTTSDNSAISYRLGDEWLDSLSVPPQWFKLVSLVGGIADWRPLTSTSLAVTAEILTDEGLPAVVPNGAGLIVVLGGTGISTAGKGFPPPGNVVTIDLDVPVTVPNGGTAGVSFTPNAVITGGAILGTDPLQNVVGTGASGNLLTSNGVGSLPSWQVAPTPGGPGSSFFAFLSVPSAPATGGGAIFPVLYDSVSYNVNAGFNTGTGLYEAQETGVHEFGIAMDLTLLEGTHTEFVVRLTINGGASVFFLAEGSPGAYRDSGDRCIINASTQIQLTLNDTVGVEIQVSGGPGTVVINGGSATQSGFFTGVFLTSSSVTGLNWSSISASQALVADNGYVVTGGAIALSLPLVSSFAQIIELTLDGGTSYVVTQAAGQQIRIGNLSTTLGVDGSLSTTATAGDSLRMICTQPNLIWRVLSQEGVFSVV